VTLLHNGTFDAALIQRAAIDFYPPTLNQANLLAEEGLRVAVLDGGIGARPAALHPDVRLMRPMQSAPASAAHRLLGLIRFRLAVRMLQSSTGVKLRIGYDSPGISVMAATRFRGLTVCHFHEYPETPSNEGRRVDAQHRVARRSARSADLTVMPDSYRAAALAEEEKLDRLPTVVRNCPRRLTAPPADRLSKTKSLRRGKLTVLFQGAISENYYADTIVKSMVWWPVGSVMVFLGPIKAAFEARLRELARELEVSRRVVLLPQVPYSDLFGYTVGADLGLTMIKPHTFNFAHMAGASNKRYEFMACGIPQISNHGPGMQQVIEGNGVGICVDPESPEEIGRQIAYLLSNESLRRKMGERGRRLHLEEYNYEMQFAGVLEALVSSLQGST
jgi:glycosyltransferase involved in cell wall biosynthesis